MNQSNLIGQYWKSVMYEFWYGYLKPKFQKKQNYVTWIQTAL